MMVSRSLPSLRILGFNLVTKIRILQKRKEKGKKKDVYYILENVQNNYHVLSVQLVVLIYV
jgi:hypothetical protein